MTDSTLGGLSALVVDDETFTRMVMVKVVQNLGFGKVHEAGDGEAALGFLETTPVQVVICDVEMRPVGGVVLLQRLRARESAQGGAVLPVLFVSNRIEPEAQAEAEALGRVRFLHKPVQGPQLRAALEDLLGGAQALV